MRLPAARRPAEGLHDAYQCSRSSSSCGDGSSAPSTVTYRAGQRQTHNGNYQRRRRRWRRRCDLGAPLMDALYRGISCCRLDGAPAGDSPVHGARRRTARSANFAHPAPDRLPPKTRAASMIRSARSGSSTTLRRGRARFLRRSSRRAISPPLSSFLAAYLPHRQVRLYEGTIRSVAVGGARSGSRRSSPIMADALRRRRRRRRRDRGPRVCSTMTTCRVAQQPTPAVREAQRRSRARRGFDGRTRRACRSPMRGLPGSGGARGSPGGGLHLGIAVEAEAFAGDGNGQARTSTRSAGAGASR